ASACAGCAPSRTCRSHGWRERSLVLPQQADEDIFQRALRRLQILEPDSCLVQIVEQRGDAGALALRVVRVDQLAAVAGKPQMMAGKLGGYRVQRIVQLQSQLLPTELAHQLGLVLDQYDLPLVDD